MAQTSKYYDVNWLGLVGQLMPTMLRKPILLSIVCAIAKQLKTIHYQWMQERESHYYRLHHTGQVCYLTEALNDLLDNEQRRIYITDSSETSQWVKCYHDTSPNRCIIGTEGGEVSLAKVWRESYLISETKWFIVHLPSDVYNDSNLLLQAKYLTNIYKLLSKRAEFVKI